jgi:hypothetical protein
MTLTHKFVEEVPENLDPAVLYVSIEYGTAVHLCCCGCGGEVVTPLGRADWRLVFDGESVSLFPSIGNWSFDCESHYWIIEGRIRWDRKWSRPEIDAMRDRRAKQRDVQQGEDGAPDSDSSDPRSGFWQLVDYLT